jgi:hypothetical protein
MSSNDVRLQSKSRSEVIASEYRYFCPVCGSANFKMIVRLNKLSGGGRKGRTELRGVEEVVSLKPRGLFGTLPMNLVRTLRG